jgi:hypothetical protein
MLAAAAAAAARHPDATEDAGMRWRFFLAGANMVTYCRSALQVALQQVAAQQQGRHMPSPAAIAAHSCCAVQDECSSYCCDWCGLPGLSAVEYWQHQPLYHINDQNEKGICQICNRQEKIERQLACDPVLCPAAGDAQQAAGSCCQMKVWCIRHVGTA